MLFPCQGQLDGRSYGIRILLYNDSEKRRVPLCSTIQRTQPADHLKNKTTTKKKTNHLFRKGDKLPRSSPAHVHGWESLILLKSQTTMLHQQPSINHPLLFVNKMSRETEQNENKNEKMKIKIKSRGGHKNIRKKKGERFNWMHVS